MSLTVTFTPEVRLVYTNLHEIKKILQEYLSEIYEVDGARVLLEALKRRHASVGEFIVFVFKIKCSRVASHQIVRHRIASYIQESQRYTTQRPEVLLPRTLLRRNIEVVETLRRLYASYRQVTETGTKRELARYLLTNCFTTKILCLWNLRELTEVIIPLRICRRAQPELRYIAFKIAQTLISLMPELADLKLIGCRGILYGKCPENEKANVKDCLRKGIEEAIMEHGTEKEIESVHDIARELLYRILR